MNTATLTHVLAAVGTALYVLRAAPAAWVLLRTRKPDPSGAPTFGLLFLAGVWWTAYSLEIFGIHFAPRPVRSYRDTLAADRELRERLFLALIAEGILIDPRGAGCLSTATGDAEIDAFARALRRVAPSLRGGGGEGTTSLAETSDPRHA